MTVVGAGDTGTWAVVVAGTDVVDGVDAGLEPQPAATSAARRRIGWSLRISGQFRRAFGVPPDGPATGPCGGPILWA
jgi:hypothetical protein